MADERKKEKDWRQTPEPPGAARGGVVVDTVDLGAVIFRRYVWERLNSEHPEHHISFEDLGGSPHELENHNVKQAVEQLITITDNIRHNPGLQRLINQVEANCPHDVFMAVANSIFEDGINWGRIVSLFHLAFELIYRAITTDHKELIRPIISLGE
ncbi:hypothetical protein NL108_007558 [Boleophthalmus pectinirostris]|nr:hypothetical protein NL108_007558 [Boleophthalmus pectinirostris]